MEGLLWLNFWMKWWVVFNLLLTTHIQAVNQRLTVQLDIVNRRLTVQLDIVNRRLTR